MSSVSSYRCPFHLLEITLISAQELVSVSKNMHTYAVTWIDPSRRLTTRVDRHGLANPSWNDKFIFRVDDAFLANPTSAVMVDIYAVSWVRDVRVGSVRALLSSLLPPPPQSSPNYSSAPIGRRMRFVALQVRRPSGRPQGILNVGFTVLDRTMRSMPLYTQLCLSPAATEETDANTKSKQEQNKTNRVQQPETPDQRVRTLRRTKSDRPDKYQQPPGSVYEGSEYGGSMQLGSEIGAPAWNGSICSDVGPSPSVVAEAVARGLYKPPGAAADDDDDGAGSMVLDEWTEESSVEGLRSKLERWRLEMPPIYDRGAAEDGDGGKQLQQQQQWRRRKHNRRDTEGGRGGGGKLFSCFANAYGCEFSVKCGAKTKKTKKNKQLLIDNGPNGGGRRSKVPLSPSELDSSYLSQSYV